MPNTTDNEGLGLLPRQPSQPSPKAANKKSSNPRGIATEGTLFHPRSADGHCTPAWYTRVCIDGVRHYFSLGDTRNEAVQLDREIRQLLRQGEDVSPVVDWVRAKVAPRPCAQNSNSLKTNGPVTVGHIVHVHRETYLEASPGTTYRYGASLLNLVETAIRHRRGLRPVDRAGRRVSLDDYGAVLNVRLTELDDNLVAEFKESRLMGVPRGSPAEKSAKISTNTELRQARCVFSQEAQLAYRRAGIILPDLTAFLSAPRFMRVTGRPQPPSDAIVIQVFTALRNLACAEDEDMFTAVCLALFAGLRRGEILNAEGSWLQERSGPSLVVRLRENFSTKNYDERTIPIPAWLHVYLHEKRGDGAFLLAGDERDRDRTLDRAVSWLRGCGLATVPKPLHALRGLYAGFLLATEPTLVRVKSRLGHADLATTFRYYADEPLSPRLVELWQQPIAVVRSPVTRF